tara:strand:+ start:201 stop:1499 length:1299 start_codon:yes stop_codon:yes gene_type:complete
MIHNKNKLDALHSQYDIVIAGGGLVGISLACALAVSNDELSILLIDNFPIKGTSKDGSVVGPIYHPSFDARATALSMSSIEIYQRLGVLEKLLVHASPISHIHVSDRGHAGSTLLSAEQQNKTAYGYVIENQWLGAVLLNRLMDLPSIELLSEASVANIVPRQKGASVSVAANHLSQNHQVKVNASLLVVADGANSGLRESLGISASIKQYDQQAVIANVQTQLPHNGHAFERFLVDGAVALLPLPDLPNAPRRSALVWTMPDQHHAQSKADLNDADFIKALQSAFGFRLGDIQHVGQRQSYPLALTLANEVIRNHIVVMGNAAHSLHPVAGQGFNLSLRDIAALTELVSEASDNNQDIGELSLLERYAKVQLKDQDITIGFSHNLIELFGRQALPIQLGRSLGLLALDILTPVKKQFSDQASGLNGRRPIL